MLRGRCSCNAVAYEVTDEFLVAYNCHCSNCRAMTGAAFLPWGEIEREKLTVTKGTDSLMPIAHMFVGSKAPWHEILDDLPQYDEYPSP